MRRNLHHITLIVAALVVAGPLTAAEPPAPLVKAAKTGSEAQRIAAIQELAAAGPKSAEAVPLLIELLTDSSPAIRARAAHALGEIGAAAKPAAEALAEMLKDADAVARRQAVRALIAIRPGREVMIPLFVRLMEDPDPGVRVRVMNGIADGGAAVVPGLIKALENEKTAYYACLILRDIGPEARDAAPALAKTLSDARPEVRREAALALGAIGAAASSAEPQLAAALGDELTREAATFALAQIGKVSPSTEKQIQASAQSENKVLSTVSLWALVRFHPQDRELATKAAEQFIARLKDEDAFVRLTAARALSSLQLDSQITLPIFEQVLADSDETTVLHALDALASLGKAAVPRLTAALEHERLRAPIAYILGQIGPDAAHATDALASLADDPNARVASESVLALAKIGPQAKAAVPKLLAALDQPECSNSQAIVYALGKIGAGDDATRSAIAARLQGEDRALAVLSAWALTKLQPQTPATSGRLVPVLVRGLEDPLPQTQTVAAEALANLGPLAKGAVPALEIAGSSDDESVRRASLEALRAIRGEKQE
jgi:HEAT repeat protein